MDVPESGGLINWFIGAWTAINLAVFGFLYTKMEKMRFDIANATESDMSKMAMSLENLRNEIASDRRLSSDERARIAGVMVTRSELDRQIDKLLSEIEKIVGNRNR